MSIEDKERIANDALQIYYNDHYDTRDLRESYILGATAEHERKCKGLTAALHLAQETNFKLKEQIKQLKQERNKAIDECKDVFKTGAEQGIIYANDLLYQMEQLKRAAGVIDNQDLK